MINDTNHAYTFNINVLVSANIIAASTLIVKCHLGRMEVEGGNVHYHCDA